MPGIKVTYFLEVISSWCHWAEPAWAELKTRYASVAEFEWKIALMHASAFPKSREQADWFYRRSGSVRRSPYMLNSGWFEDGMAPYHAPNLVALAAQELGVLDDSVRLALAHAALRDGRKVGQWTTAVEIAAEASGLMADTLLSKARSPEILALAERTTAEFASLQISQRPAFVITSNLGDKAIFSGLVTLPPLVASIEAMLEDARGYASYQAHFGDIPG